MTAWNLIINISLFILGMLVISLGAMRWFFNGEIFFGAVYIVLGFAIFNVLIGRVIK